MNHFYYLLKNKNLQNKKRDKNIGLFYILTSENLRGEANLNVSNPVSDLSIRAVGTEPDNWLFFKFLQVSNMISVRDMCS